MKSKKGMIKYYITILLIFIVIILISPVMGIKEIYVEGNEKYSQGEICKMLSVSKGNNLLAFSSRKMIKEMKKNPYIKEISVNKNYLNRTLEITVSERKISGYVKYNSSAYLYVDNEGRVLEVNSFFEERHPIVEGLEFSEFIVGEILTVNNKDAFKTMVNLSVLFEKFNIEHDVISVDVSDSKNIHFYYGKIDIILGTSDELDLKVRKMQGVINKIDELDLKETGGFLYLDDPTNPPRFKFLR